MSCLFMSRPKWQELRINQHTISALHDAVRFGMRRSRSCCWHFPFATAKRVPTLSFDCPIRMPHTQDCLRRGISNFANPVAALALVFCVTIVFLGGASRADALSQVVVRLVSIITIAALLVQRPDWSGIDRVRPLFNFACLAGLLLLLQLIPLPPELWSALPGRAHDVALSKLVSTTDGWRPINLTPDLGLNAAMALLPVFAVIALLTRLNKTYRLLPVAVVASAAVLSAVLGLAQLTGGPDSGLRYYAITSESSAVGVFANRNHNATLLALSIPIIAFFGTRGVHPQVTARGATVMALAATFVVLVMIPATASRFGLVAGLIGLAGSFVWWKKPLNQMIGKSRRRTKWAIIGGMLALVGAAIMVAITSTRAEAIRRLFNASLESEQRLAIGPTLIEMARTYFPVGSGFGSFDPVFRRFEPIDNLSDVYLNHAHNDFIQIAIEGGLPALALVGLYVVWWVRTAAHVWRLHPVDETIEIARLGTIITAIILASSIVDYPLRTPLVAAIFTVASWGMALGLNRHKGLAKPVPRKANRAKAASG